MPRRTRQTSPLPRRCDFQTAETLGKSVTFQKCSSQGWRSGRLFDWRLSNNVVKTGELRRLQPGRALVGCPPSSAASNGFEVELADWIGTIMLREVARSQSAGKEPVVPVIGG